MSQDYAPATETLTTHHDGWGIFQPRWIILHGTAGFQTAQQVADYFLSNDPPSSTHYVVGRDGAVVQCVRESQAAWGNGGITGPAGASSFTRNTGQHDAWWDSTPIHNPNPYTFSIEHVKPSTDNSDLLTAAQQAASFALIKHLCEAHNIPKRAADSNGGITGHFSMDPVNRAFCPGPYPWGPLWAFLAGGSTVVNTSGLGTGDAQEAQAEQSSVAIPETYFGHQSVATLQNGTALYWDGAHVNVFHGAAPAIKLLLDDRAALLAQTTQLKAQIAQLQQQQTPPAVLLDLQQLQQIVADALAKAKVGG